MVDSLRCIYRNEIKPFSELVRDNRSLYGYRRCCKACVNVYQKSRRYGLTSEQRLGILSKQNSECACCKNPVKGRFDHLDHDKQTGMVYTILCHQCNIAAGMLNHSPYYAELMVGYLTWRQEHGNHST